MSTCSVLAERDDVVTTCSVLAERDDVMTI